MKLGTNIRALRKAKGLTLEEVGNAVGIRRASVSLWESSDTRPDLDRLVGLARLFGVTVDYLLTGDASKPPNITAVAPDVWPFTVSRKRFDAMPPQEKNRVDRFVTDTVEVWESTTPESRKAG
jgi:transcriptional regulator with XRE-family HTH domain